MNGKMTLKEFEAICDYVKNSLGREGTREGFTAGLYQILCQRFQLAVNEQSFNVGPEIDKLLETYVKESDGTALTEYCATLNRHLDEFEESR